MKLNKNNLKKLIASLLTEDINYTVQSGETASGIAQKHGISLTQLMGSNPDKGNLDRINVGDILIIPVELDQETEASNVEAEVSDDERATVAALLCGECDNRHFADGSENSRTAAMRNIYTVIVNRSESNYGRQRSLSLSDVALRVSPGGSVHDFSYWDFERNGAFRGNDIARTVQWWSSRHPAVWETALNVYDNGGLSTDQYGNARLRGACYYYNPDIVDPGWGRRHPCWVEVLDDGDHCFGIGGRVWNSCVERAPDASHRETWYNRVGVSSVPDSGTEDANDELVNTPDIRS